MSQVNNICITLKSYNDITNIIDELNRLNLIFCRLIKEIILEREIKKYFSEIKIKSCCEQDEEFENFLNYETKKIEPIDFSVMDDNSSFMREIIENNF
jgi:hypothetical protein